MLMEALVWFLSLFWPNVCVAIDFFIKPFRLDRGDNAKSILSLSSHAFLQSFIDSLSFVCRCDLTVWNRTKSKCDPLISLGAK